MTQVNITTILEQAKPHEQHDWVLTSAEVAEGYGISTSTLRGHKSNKTDELLEHQHWIKDGQSTLWTKAGVVQLGFHIQSERGKEFRALAEQLVLSAMEQQVSPTLTATAIDEDMAFSALDDIAKTIADAVAPDAATHFLKHRVHHHLPAAIDRNLEEAGKALGVSLANQYGLDMSVHITKAITNYRTTQAAA